MTDIPRTTAGGLGQPIQALFLGVPHSIVTSATSQATPAFQASTSAILVWATRDTYIDIGQTPNALTTSFPIPAGTVIAFGVRSGDSLAARQVATSGTIFIAEGV